MQLAVLVSGLVFLAILTTMVLLSVANETLYASRRALLEARIGRPPEQQGRQQEEEEDPSPFGPLGEHLDRRLARAGIDIGAGRFALLSIGIAGAVTASISQLSPAWAFLGVLTGVLPYLGLGWLEQQRVHRMERQLPGAIEVMIASLRGGATLERAVADCRSEVEEPLASELRDVHERLSLGVGLPNALEAARRRHPGFHSLHFALGVMQLQRRSGGNLVEMLGRVRDAQRDLLTAEQRIAAAQAEARTTGRMLFIGPLLMLAILFLFFPGYIGMLTEHPTARTVFVTSLLWLGIGLVVTGRLTRPEDT